MRFFTCILMILTLGLLGGCSRTVDNQILRDAHKASENGALIVDVRSVDEFKGGHVDGAINISIDVLDKQYTKLSKKTTLIVYCRSGSRSSSAAGFLTSKGYTVYDVATQSEWEREVPPPELDKK